MKDTQHIYKPTLRDLRERATLNDTEDELRLLATILNDPEDDDPRTLYTLKRGGRA